MSARRATVILAFGLLIFFAARLGSPDNAQGLIWIDGLLGILALMISVISPEIVPGSRRPIAPFILAGALLAIALVGLSTQAPLWFFLGNLAFTVAFIIVGLLSKPKARKVETEELRKSA